ncbi:DUF6884 domain-containing protein [Streptomyces sp. NPDC001422]|uniref:DUF6884 domain-containing protein n=1 Tax=Streptomyces sp. NPDC001422 TaxID=3364575 RepID=UPI00367FB48E
MKITVPGQLRRHVAKELDPQTRGERNLQDACRKEVLALVGAKKSFLVTSDIELTNDALGAALDIARGWLNSSNGNNVQAARSLLKAHELDYEPDDPREIRTEIKTPKSLAEQIKASSTHREVPDVLTEDFAQLSWATGMSGRVRPETLAWLMERAHYWAGMHPTASVQRAAKKFVTTHEERHERLQRMIASTLDIEDEEEPETPAPERKRLILVACGGKKLDTPSTAAGEMYVGSYHKACRKAADALGDWVMILSAKYGLVGLDDAIDAYDMRIGDPGAITPEELTKQARDLEILDADVTVLGGSAYADLASQVWEVDRPVSGGIGQQLKQLAEIYKGEVLEDDEDQAPEKTGPEIAKHKMMKFVQWNDKPTYFHYAGLAKKKATEPRLVYSIWTQSNEGKNLLRDATTHEPIVAVHSSSHVWAAPADPSEIPAPEVEEPKEPEKPEEPARWFVNDLRLIPGTPSLHRPSTKDVWFGGKVARSRTRPSERWRRATISYIGESEFDVCDTSTGDLLLRCKGNVRIAWGPVEGIQEAEPETTPEVPAPVEESEPEPELEPEPEPTPDPEPMHEGPYEVPENFLELAEEANTDAAKRYWKARCERYAKTGK